MILYLAISGETANSTQFLERIMSCEIGRLKEYLQASELTEEYVNYLMNNIVPFLEAYKDKYLANIESMNDKDHKDLGELRTFSNELLKKI